MKLLHALMALVCLQSALAFAPRTAAQARAAPSGSSAARLSANFELRAGASTAPYFTRALPEVRGHGFVGLLRARYRLDERHHVGVEAPLLAISVRQPAGSYLDELAWGNLLLSYRHERALLAAQRLRLRVHAGGALGLPIAELRDSAMLLAGRARRIGAALDGFRHPELYTAGVVPLVASLGATLERSWFSAAASLRLPLLVRFSDAALPSDARTRALGVTAVLHLGLAAEVTRWFELSLGADTALEAVPAVEARRDPGRAQLTLQPAVGFRLPRGVRLGSSFVLPVAGPLAGSTYAGSFVLGYRR